MLLPCDVLCLGHAAYDLTFTVAHHPAPDEKSVADRLVSSGGGPAANAAVAVARLGGRSAFAGYLGQDVYGDLHLAELEAEGVDTRLVARGLDPTPLSVILAKPDGRRSLINYRGQTRPLPPHSINLSYIQPQVILFDGLEPDASPPIAQWARARGIPTVLDAGSVHRGTEALVGLVDFVVASEKFGLGYTGVANPVTAVARLAQKGQTAVITLGERGLVWQSPTGAGQMAAWPVTAVDSTGAGDAFHGAFAYGLALGQPWLELLRYASAAGALCCTCYGARVGLPGATAVAELMGAGGE
jgi:sulfofructose kinase